MIRIATAQFPVSARVESNLRYLLRQIEEASGAGADIVHFPETSLGGYAGGDFHTWDNYDWGALEGAEERVIAKARNLAIGVVYGTNRLRSDERVENCLVAVSSDGTVVARYAKRFCTTTDVRFYRPGREFATFDLHGMRCGLLICYDVRFPELFREYKKLGTQILFHSFYNARSSGRNIHTTIMRPTLQASAASNYLYISASNASGHYQSWPSVFILPDGTIASSAIQHRSSIIVTTVDPEATFYDASGPFRERAMSGKLFSEP